ncbi:MAG: molybdenum cofactor biosynthesis protein MoaE [Alphaproteobacteria bacterium]|nr:molybdenum cofactor biosynthesis protein MoaE [Alphaproteobacteria bacterium]
MVSGARVQAEPFDPSVELKAFSARNVKSGGIATFIGQMRDTSADGETINAMTLEHYPAMADVQLAELIAEAKQRWPLDDVRIVHRVGTLKPGDPIVFVATASAHREAAFHACEFLMDWLKTKAPIWKKESGATGAAWVEAKTDDDRRAGRWR